jgi:cytochrome b
MKHSPVPVWDLPIRLFHWLLLASVVLAVVAAKTSWLSSDWHEYAGVSITFLWLFRFFWGFLGTQTARFVQFFPTPSRVSAQWQGHTVAVGHSASGALSVLALLSLLAGMLVTGVFADDDISLHGPLSTYISAELSDWLTEWHGRIFYLLLGMVVLHIAAIAYYARIKRDNLVRPMLSGYKQLPEHTAGNRMPAGGHFWLNLAISLILATGLTWLLFSPQAQALFVQPQAQTVTPVSQHQW